MNILLLNSILYTAQNNIIPKVESIKDCMIYNLSLGFKELGHNVTLIAASDYKPIKEESYEIRVIFIKSNIKKFFLPSVLPLQSGLLKYLNKESKNFDLIISSEVFAFPSLFSTIIAPEQTIIWHELAVHTKKMKSIPSYFWYNVIAKLFFRKAKIVARSERAKNFISRYIGGVSDSSVEHGINLNKFHFSKDKKNQFVVVGQLIPRKNIKSIILKFQELVQNKSYSNFKLLIVGKGELENDLKNTVKKEGLESQVKLIGFKRHEKLNLLISESMALLIDTKQDNNMVSIPESIACGTPILTNLVPTNSNLIKEEHLGIAKENWDSIDLIEIIANNSFYSENCKNYRKELSSLNTAQKLIDAFMA